MAENFNRESSEKEVNLKRKDARKNSADGSLRVVNLSAGKRSGGIALDERISQIKVKKKLPLAVDIIAGILMLALVIAVIIVSYMLFRYYSNDYTSKNVTYEMIVTAGDDLSVYEDMEKKEIYLDTSDNSVYFGEITEVIVVDGENNMVIFTVRADVKYRKNEGYSIGERRLAVGSEFSNLRCGEQMLGSAAVVELTVGGGE